ncbi:MAG TPA: DUF2254 domain-containing protein [Tepidisphaeraceae bacterium]|jgi:uncharacterized membrane protein
MPWLARYRVRHFLENSVCVFPIMAIFAAMGLARALHRLDALMAAHVAMDPDAARTVLATLAASIFTCVAFISSSLLLVVQLASAQLTPRIIGSLFRDRPTKFAMTLFVFTFTLSIAALVRVGDTVPQLTVMIATYACVASLATLLFLIDHIGRVLRPSGAMRVVARSGRNVIQAVYKRSLTDADETSAGASDLPRGEPSLTFANLHDGVILAVDIDGLVARASRADALVQIVPQVGDFVAAGEPLFRVFGGRAPIPPHALRTSIALGPERTLEQDPTLAFRILVDVASKALSPAINDPTTAVLAIDQIHHLLRTVAARRLNDGAVRDRNGALRLVYPRPAWEDYVNLAVTEIRQFGCTSIQVARRLNAMLTDLLQKLPEHRAPALRRQRDLLYGTCERSFPEPEDRALAEVGDFQGVGGSVRPRESILQETIHDNFQSH